MYYSEYFVSCFCYTLPKIYVFKFVQVHVLTLVPHMDFKIAIFSNPIELVSPPRAAITSVPVKLSSCVTNVCENQSEF